MFSLVECGQRFSRHSCGSRGIATCEMGEGCAPLSQSLPRRTFTRRALSPSQFANFMGMEGHVFVEVIDCKIPRLLIVKDEVWGYTRDNARVTRLQWST